MHCLWQQQHPTQLPPSVVVAACRNWGKQDLIRDVKFTTNVTLLDNVAVVKYTMSYAGTITHVRMTHPISQEMSMLV
jgi:hypothetical protein